MKKTRELISNRFAVVAIVVVLAASSIGWFSSELIPPDFRSKIHLYEKEWGVFTCRVVSALELYDPFHSLWYRMVLVFFFFTLFLCVLSNWRRFLKPYVRSVVEFPSGVGGTDRWNVVSYSWRKIKGAEDLERDPVLWYGEKFGRSARVSPETLPVLFKHVSTELKKRGYSVRRLKNGTTVRFSAEKGRLRYAGSFGLHVAILVIAVGGLIGSFFGWSEIMYGKPGDTVPLGESGYTLRVDDFWIDTTAEGEISDFVSLVSVWKGGDSLSADAIRVNHPLSVSGLNVLQHSYRTEEDEFEWAKIGYRLNGEILWKSFVIKPGERVFLADSTLSVRIMRFFPDFKMMGGKPFTRNGFPANPAVKIEVQTVDSHATGWLFLKYPEFNSDLKVPVSFSLMDVEPVFYSGLQITSNPGSSMIFTGIAIGTVSLVIMLFSNYRKIVGELDSEGFHMKGARYQWKESFKGECARITDDVLNVLRTAMKGVRIDEVDH